MINFQQKSVEVELEGFEDAWDGMFDERGFKVLPGALVAHDEVGFRYFDLHRHLGFYLVHRLLLAELFVPCRQALNLLVSVFQAHHDDWIAEILQYPRLKQEWCVQDDE